MGVLVEGHTLLVPLQLLVLRFAGGVAGYRRWLGASPFCCDEFLTSVRLDSPQDVEARVIELEGMDVLRALDRHPLVAINRDPALGRHTAWGEGSVVSIWPDLSPDAAYATHGGDVTPRPWLDIGPRPEGFVAAWWRGSDADPVAVPEGWSLEGSLTQRGDPMAAPRYVYLGRFDDSEAFYDHETGRIVAGAPTTSAGCERIRRRCRTRRRRGARA